MSRALAVGLLVAAGTAASLSAAELHGVLILLAIAAAAAAAGAVAWANAVKKNACEVTQAPPSTTKSN